METITAQTGGKPIKIWFADEARIEQKNTLGEAWHTALRAARNEPRRPISSEPFARQRRGLGFAMALHLEEIATSVAPGAHAILVLDWQVACLEDAARPSKHHTLCRPNRPS